jgi:hypothetical protein
MSRQARAYSAPSAEDGPGWRRAHAQPQAERAVQASEPYTSAYLRSMKSRKGLAKAPTGHCARAQREERGAFAWTCSHEPSEEGGERPPVRRGLHGPMSRSMASPTGGVRGAQGVLGK